MKCVDFPTPEGKINAFGDAHGSTESEKKQFIKDF